MKNRRWLAVFITLFCLPIFALDAAECLVTGDVTAISNDASQFNVMQLSISQEEIHETQDSV